ncbi:hypothetical protein BaRGS_00025868, partial [Batillaria attramentaria]
NPQGWVGKRGEWESGSSLWRTRILADSLYAIRISEYWTCSLLSLEVYLSLTLLSVYFVASDIECGVPLSPAQTHSLPCRIHDIDRVSAGYQNVHRLNQLSGEFMSDPRNLIQWMTNVEFYYLPAGSRNIEVRLLTKGENSAFEGSPPDVHFEVTALESGPSVHIRVGDSSDGYSPVVIFLATLVTLALTAAVFRWRLSRTTLTRKQT